MKTFTQQELDEVTQTAQAYAMRGSIKKVAKHNRKIKNPSKRQRLLIQEKCKNKITYKTAPEAWQDAFFFSIKHNTLMVPYKCHLSGEPHYHLSSHHTIGDGSHVPEEYKEMLLLIGENEKPAVSFWQRLRNVLL